MKYKEKKEHKSKKALLRFFLYGICGSLCALPIAVPSLWLLGWVAPCPVFYFEYFLIDKKDSYIRAYGRGMSFFWFFGVVTFHWFWKLYPLDFLGFDKASALLVVILASFGIPLLQALVSSLIFVAVCFVRKRGLLLRFPAVCSILFASLFCVGEYLHTLTWLGVPWGRLAVGQTGCLAVIQSASLFGCAFIAFIMTLFSALLSVFIKRLEDKSFRRSAAILLATLLVFFSNLGFGLLRLYLPEKDRETVTVGAVQGNIRFEDKWANKPAVTKDTYKDLSLACVKDGAALVIWPETALPYDCSEYTELYDYFSEIGTLCGCECLVTVFESEDGELYNTARLVDPDGTIDGTVYKKQHLVPFGEYVPMEKLISTVIPPLADLCAMMDQVSPGDGSEIIETENGNIGTLICFDSIYEQLCLQSVRDGAELICIVTNDSWFTGSAALSQHNAQAVLRSVENGRYTVRSANTGISSVISPKGRIIASLGDSEKGYITADVSFIEENTLYTHIGNSFVVICAVIIFAFFICATVYKKKRSIK